VSRDPRLYLTDILDSARKIREVTATHFFHEFREEWMVRDAVARNFELIGEAARRLGPELHARAPEVEWAKLMGLRKILLHAYFTVDDEILWDAATSKVPTLEAAARRLLDALGAP
jgi:uncharacterized protein with HEPN domain